MSLVTLENALRHLRLVVGDLPDPEQHVQATEVEFKLTQASAIVTDYLQPKPEPAWTAEDCPGAVQAAVLLVLSDLWEHRAGSDGEDVFLSAAAKSLLRPYRRPTLA